MMAETTRYSMPKATRAYPCDAGCGTDIQKGERYVRTETTQRAEPSNKPYASTVRKEHRSCPTKLTSVWVPAGLFFNTECDHPGWEDVTIYPDEPEFFWFATEAACKAECDQRNAKNKETFEAQYQAYVNAVAAKNAAADARRTTQIMEHEVLVQAGLREPQDFPMPTHEQAQTFEQWSRWRNPGTNWKPQEFKRAATKPEEPSKPGPCEHCGTSYEDCTKKVLSQGGACCPSCAISVRHPGMDIWEAWSRKAQANV